jgi:hypothetical protein
MKWDQTDFLHLFIPLDESPTVWDERRTPASDPGSFPSGSQALFSPFSSFTPRDLVQQERQTGAREKKKKKSREMGTGLSESILACLYTHHQ